jgi:hypothetical protein
MQKEVNSFRIIGGKTDSENIYLYIRDLKSNLLEMHFNVTSDTFSSSIIAGDVGFWWDVVRVTDKSRKLFFSHLSSSIITMVTYKHDKWKQKPTNCNDSIFSAKGVTTNKRHHCFIQGTSRTFLKEIYYTKHEFCYQEFKVPGHYLNSPIPFLDPSSTISTVVDNKNAIHVFCFSSNGALQDLTWDETANSWSFRLVTVLPSRPSCMLSSRVFNKRYDVSWDFNSLSAILSGEKIKVFVNVIYSIERIVPRFCARMELTKTGFLLIFGVNKFF